MVQLTLYSPKGNQGARYFPYQGYLGLTPVRVEGAVRTKLDADLKPAIARSLTVAIRCYEARMGRLGSVNTRCLAELVQVLWSPKPKDPSSSESPEYGELGDSEHTFRLQLPAKFGGLSMVNYPEYRVYWRVEAVIDHAPIPGVGTRMLKFFDLPFIRHDVPSPLIRSSAALSPVPTTSSATYVHLPFHQATAKGRMPILRYNLTVPSDPIGPEDLVSVPLSVQPLDPSIVIRNASLIIERRMDLLPASSTTTVSAPPPPTPPSSSPRPSTRSKRPRTAPSSDDCTTPTLANTHSVYSGRHHDSATTGPVASGSSWSLPTTAPSTSTGQSRTTTDSSLFDHGSTNTHTALLPPSPMPASSSTAPSSPRAAYATSAVIASSEVSGEHFARNAPSSVSGAGDTWSKTLTAQWPATRSTHKWAIGESTKTELAHVRYIVRVRLIVGTHSGMETLELEGEEVDWELLVVSTNDAERRLALAKTDEAIRYKKSKSQSPKRRARASSGEGDAERPRKTTRDTPSPSSSLPNAPPSAPPALWRSSANASGSSTSSDDSTLSHSGSSTLMAAPLPSDSKDSRPRTVKPAKERLPRAPRIARRPHTSAGPGDSRGAFGAPRAGAPPLSFGRTAGAEWASVPRNSNDLRQSMLVSDREMRAWEEELARIENVSRRSSVNMLGGRRGAPPVGMVGS